MSKYSNVTFVCGNKGQLTIMSVLMNPNQHPHVIEGGFKNQLGTFTYGTFHEPESYIPHVSERLSSVYLKHKSGSLCQYMLAKYNSRLGPKCWSMLKSRKDKMLHQVMMSLIWGSFFR